VDAVADGEDVLIGGIMEHVESAGVHSGDSACMIPPRSLSDETLARVREVTEGIATALDTVGLLNVQLAVRDGEVFVLEANPRSSRTVPFVSKATGVPIAKLAAKVMAGNSLTDLAVDEQIPEQTSVKEVVLPFDRLPGSDPRLGPEMKSTGEVMGSADTFGKAYDKAQDATGKPIPKSGTIALDLSDENFPDPDTEAGEALADGFGEFYEFSDAVDLIDAAALATSMSSSRGTASYWRSPSKRRSPTSRRRPARAPRLKPCAPATSRSTYNRSPVGRNAPPSGVSRLLDSQSSPLFVHSGAAPRSCVASDEVPYISSANQRDRSALFFISFG